MLHGKSLAPLRGVTHVAWSCEAVSALQKKLMDGCDDSRKLRSLAQLLRGRRNVGKCVCGYLFLSQGHAKELGWEPQAHPPNMQHLSWREMYLH